MKVLLGCVLFSLVSFSAFANPPLVDPNVWMLINESADGHSFSYFKKGSFAKDGNSRRVIVQTILDHSVTYQRISVSNQDCQNKYGKVVFSTLQDRFLFEADYLDRGSSTASFIGTAICSIGR
ncbi:hypothetical protein [Citrobacter sp. NCU1]|uniref:hypothetical protein n=1 Tax=Citrobacter sp. NCU1 TaxID=2026683 RepID=UPI00139158B0|nr:hypothetical protein [Citrobacter sp. NCU1]